MVEIFRTNVSDPVNANLLIARISRLFNYEVSFDLEDCDRILRVKSHREEIKPEDIISVLKEFGFHAQVLPENYPLPLLQSLIKKVPVSNCW